MALLIPGVGLVDASSTLLIPGAGPVEQAASYSLAVDKADLSPSPKTVTLVTAVPGTPAETSVSASSLPLRVGLPIVSASLQPAGQAVTLTPSGTEPQEVPADPAEFSIVGQEVGLSLDNSKSIPVVAASFSLVGSALDYEQEVWLDQAQVQPSPQIIALDRQRILDVVAAAVSPSLQSVVFRLALRVVSAAPLIAGKPVLFISGLPITSASLQPSPQIITLQTDTEKVIPVVAGEVSASPSLVTLGLSSPVSKADLSPGPKASTLNVGIPIVRVAPTVITQQIRTGVSTPISAASISPAGGVINFVAGRAFSLPVENAAITFTEGSAAYSAGIVVTRALLSITPTFVYRPLTAWAVVSVDDETWVDEATDELTWTCVDTVPSESWTDVT